MHILGMPGHGLSRAPANIEVLSLEDLGLGRRGRAQMGWPLKWGILRRFLEIRWGWMAKWNRRKEGCSELNLDWGNPRAYFSILIIVPYNLNQMQQQCGKLRRFKDLDFVQFQEHQPVEKEVRKPALLNLPQKPEPNIKTAPGLHPQGNHYEISFQSTFMDEHEAAFRKQAENFMESALKEKDYATLGFNAIRNVEHVSFDPKALTAAQDKQFEGQLEKEQKLMDLISMVNRNTGLQVASQLRYLTYLGWQGYLAIKSPFISDSQLKENAQKLAQGKYESLFKESGIKFLNLEAVHKFQLKSQPELLKAFRVFLGFYFTTVFFVAEGYFENPFFLGSERAKRSRDYSQLYYSQNSESFSDDLNFYPSKKLSPLQ